MRSLGQNPTELEVVSMLDSESAGHSGTIDFSQFLTMMAKQLAKQDGDDKEEMREALNTMAGDTGVVKLAEIYTTMRNLGKNLPGKFDEPDSPDPEPVADDNREFTFEEFLVEFAGCGFAK